MIYIFSILKKFLHFYSIKNNKNCIRIENFLNGTFSPFYNKNFGIKTHI